MSDLVHRIDSFLSLDHCNELIESHRDLVQPSKVSTPKERITGL